MAAFVKNDITEKGLALLAKVQMGEKLTFSKIGIGSGTLPGTTSIRKLTAMIQPVMDVSITRKKINEDQTVTIGGIFNNTDVQQEFYFRELALYAIDPNVGEILYCYGNAGNGAELIPAHDTQTLVEKIVDIVTYIGDATEVNALMKTEAYASVQDLEELSDEVDNVKMEVSDIQDKLVQMQQNLDMMGVHVYTHKKTGTVHNFTGEGATGRAKITADFETGDTIQLNGKPVTGTSGSEPVNGDTLVNGQWVLFVADAEGGQINFKGGGGLSDTMLNQATATTDHVWIGDTFYAKGSKAVQTGTLDVPGATATPADVVATKTFIAGSAAKQTGTLQDQPSRTNALSLSAVQSDGYMLARIPKGAYRQADESGYPVVGVSQSDVFNSLNLSEKGGVTDALSVYEYDDSNVGLRIPAGIYKTEGSAGYPVIKAPNDQILGAMGIESRDGKTPMLSSFLDLNIEEKTLNVGFRIPKGLYEKEGDGGYPVITVPPEEVTQYFEPRISSESENSAGTGLISIGMEGSIDVLVFVATQVSGNEYITCTIENDNCTELFKKVIKIQDGGGTVNAMQVVVGVKYNADRAKYSVHFNGNANMRVTYQSINYF